MINITYITNMIRNTCINRNMYQILYMAIEIYNAYTLYREVPYLRSCVPHFPWDATPLCMRITRINREIYMC